MSSRSGQWVVNGGRAGSEIEEVSQLDGLLREAGGAGLERADEAVRRLAEAWGRTLAEYRRDALAPVAESAQVALRAVYPQELRPMPAFTVLRFEPRPGTISERRIVPRGTLVPCRADGDSSGSEAPTLRFTTTASFELAPLRSIECRRGRVGDGGVLELSLQASEPGPASRVLPARLRLFASHPHPEGALALRAGLLAASTRVAVEATGVAGTVHRRTVRGVSALLPVGLETRSLRRRDADSTGLLPWPRRADEGVRLLQELAVHPLKFAFVDLGLEDFGLGALLGGEAVAALKVRFEGLPEDVSGELVPFCTPAANLFPWEARPIRFDDARTDHPVTPESPLGPEGEVFSVEEVRSLGAGGAKVPPLESSAPSAPGFEVIRRRSGRGVRCLLRLAGQAGMPGPGVSASLLCTDGSIAERHRVARLTSETLPEASVASVAPISSPLPPRDREDAHRRLLALLGGEREERLSVAGLRRELEFAIPCEHLAAGRLAEAVQDLVAEPRDRISGRSWIRTCRVRIGLDASACSGLGDFSLVADVLGAWVRSVVPINTLAETVVEDPRRGWCRESVGPPALAGESRVR